MHIVEVLTSPDKVRLFIMKCLFVIHLKKFVAAQMCQSFFCYGACMVKCVESFIGRCTLYCAIMLHRGKKFPSMCRQAVHKHSPLVLLL